MAASVSRTRFLPGIGQPSQRGADRLGGVHHHGVGGMGVFEGRLRASVAEQPPDREHGLAPPERDAGVGMPQIVQPQIAQI